MLQLTYTPSSGCIETTWIEHVGEHSTDFIMANPNIKWFFALNVPDDKYVRYPDEETRERLESGDI